MNCIFCKIIAKEVPNYTVYEDESVLAFLDIFPCSKGHTVVIPKQHMESVLALSIAEYDKLLEGVRAAATRVQEILQPDGFNIGINERPAAGQAVPHIHWHIIPRYEGDGGGSMHSIVKNAGNSEVKEIAKMFSDKD